MNTTEQDSISSRRRRARATIAEAAIWADCSPTTWRLFEANPHAVGRMVRERCAAALTKIDALAKAHEAA